MSGNEAQREFWNGPAGDGWVRAQAGIDAALNPLSDIAIAHAAVVAGERIIDVGCGCGTTSMVLHEKGGQVWGIDLSGPMIAYAKERVAGMDGIAFSVTDAANQNYTPDHDLVFSRFGVMFFADPTNAFSQIRTSLKSGGRMVFLAWQAASANSWMSVPMAAARPFMPETPPADPHAPGPFAFADADRVRDILTSAGFTDIDVKGVTAPFHMGDDLDSAINFQRASGPLGRVIAELDDETRETALTAVKEALAPHASEQGVRLEGAAWVVSARNP